MGKKDKNNFYSGNDEELFEPMSERGTPEPLEETYVPPSYLGLPMGVQERFKEAGYTLRWVRIYTGNELDVTNIRQKEREGWVPVTTEEIPEMNKTIDSYFGNDVNKHKDLIVIGENALYRIPTAKIEARKKYYEDQNRARNKAIIQDLKEHQIGDPSRGDTFKSSWGRSKKVEIGE